MALTREQMIDEAVRRVGPETRMFSSCFWDAVRREFRDIQSRQWLARCEDMKQRYAHTYEVKK